MASHSPSTPREPWRAPNAVGAWAARWRGSAVRAGALPPGAWVAAGLLAGLALLLMRPGNVAARHAPVRLAAAAPVVTIRELPRHPAAAHAPAPGPRSQP